MGEDVSQIRGVTRLNAGAQGAISAEASSVHIEWSQHAVSEQQNAIAIEQTSAVEHIYELVCGAAKAAKTKDRGRKHIETLTQPRTLISIPTSFLSRARRSRSTLLALLLAALITRTKGTHCRPRVRGRTMEILLFPLMAKAGQRNFA